MKNLFRISGVILLILLIQSCKKSDDNLIRDADGNVYHTVTIGSQIWAVENLKTTKYDDNTDIPLVTDNAEWAALSTPACCWYNNDIANKEVYGALYNWYTVSTNKLCPNGWHVPTDADWTNLTEYLTNNGYGYEGSGEDIGKSVADTSGWTIDPTAGNVGNDQSSNNSSGFTAIPSGNRHMNGSFASIGDIDCWWSATEMIDRLNNDAVLAVNREINTGFNDVSGSPTNMQCGFSIRCLMDN
jgi:uncharacterized protein (TIGR02145 family)